MVEVIGPVQCKCRRAAPARYFPVTTVCLPTETANGLAPDTLVRPTRAYSIHPLAQSSLPSLDQKVSVIEYNHDAVEASASVVAAAGWALASAVSAEAN